MKTRQIEVYVGWYDHTWSTDWVDIPADTAEEKVEETAIAALWAAFANDQPDEPIAFVGVYCTNDDMIPEMDEVPEAQP